MHLAQNQRVSAKRNRLRVYYRVGQDEPRSVRWQLWADRTSFYLVNEALGDLKISLHGFDPRHPAGGRFHVKPAHREGLLQSTSIVLTNNPEQGWPFRFRGFQTGDGRLAIRLRTTHRACLLSPPVTSPPRPSSASATVKVPLPGWSADLDLTFQQLPATFVPANIYSSSVNVAHGGAEVQMGLPGPVGGGQAGFIVRNDVGVVLRGRTRYRRFDVEPTPPALEGQPIDAMTPSPTRQLAMGVDENSVLWIVEDASHWDYLRLHRQ